MDSAQIEEVVREEIDEIEQKRVEDKKKVSRSMIICFALAAVLGVVFLVTKVSPFFFLLVIGIAVIPFLYRSYLKSGLISRLKQQVFLPVLKKLRPGISYESTSYISQSLFNQSNLFSAPDRYNGEDLFSGKKDKTTFSFSEIHAEKEHRSVDSKGNVKKTYSTIFDGIFMIADFNKEIQNETYVYSRGGKWLSKFKRVRLENPEFEDNFKTYSDDQVEARYILTPSLMEKIINLEKRFQATLYLSFRGNNVFIAIGTSTNFFEPQIGDKISGETIEKIIREVDSCLEIIEELDLNTRIWTKE